MLLLLVCWEHGEMGVMEGLIVGHQLATLLYTPMRGWEAAPSPTDLGKCHGEGWRISKGCSNTIRCPTFSGYHGTLNGRGQWQTDLNGCPTHRTVVLLRSLTYRIWIMIRDEKDRQAAQGDATWHRLCALVSLCVTWKWEEVLVALGPFLTG